MFKLILTIVFSCVSIVNIHAQTMDIFSFYKDLDTELNRKMVANELYVEEEFNFLLVNFGSKPTYISLFSMTDWKVVQNFRLPDWVEFAGCYYNQQLNAFYIKESRYGDRYYLLDIKSGEVELLECINTPRHCPVVEPRKYLTDVKVLDNQFRIMVDKKNKRLVKVYKMRE